MLHSISLSSRTSSTPAIPSSYLNQHNNSYNSNQLSRTSLSSRTTTSIPAPTSALSSLTSPSTLSSSPSATALIPSSTGTVISLTKATFQQHCNKHSKHSNKSNNNCPNLSPVLRSQHQHHLQQRPFHPSSILAGHPFLTKNSPYKARPNFTPGRVSTSSSGPTTVSSSPCSFLYPSDNKHSPRPHATKQQQQNHSQASTAARLSGATGVRAHTLAVTTISHPTLTTSTSPTPGAGAALFLDEQGQPQLLKLSSHHPLLPASLPVWLSAGAGNQHQLQQTLLRHQQQHCHHHGHQRHFPDVVEYSSKTGHDCMEKSRQLSTTTTAAYLEDAMSNPTIIDTATLLPIEVIGMPSSRSSNIVETEAETGGSQCGGESEARNEEEEEQVVVEVVGGIDYTDDGHDEIGWNTAKTATKEQLQPNSPLTPIPTNAGLIQSPSSSSSSSLFTLLQQQQQQQQQHQQKNSFTDNAVCMTPPPRRSCSFIISSSTCSQDWQHPGTTITTTTTPATTTLPLTAEVIGPTTFMHTSNLDEQQQEHQVIIHPPTPRSKPKPSPIATKSLPRRANSLGQSTATANTSIAAHQEREGESFLNESNVITNNTDYNARPATCGLGGAFLQASSAVTECRKNGSSSSGDEEEARDSGIVLEPWDQSLLQHEQQHNTLFSETIIIVKPETTTTAAKEQQQQKQQILPFPSFDQLFQPNLDLIDPQILKRGSSDQRSQQRRQRCQSMYCPPTPREIELDDQGSRSNDDIADSNANLIKAASTAAKGDNDNNNNRAQSGTASKSAEQKIRRSKRVASMSIGSDHPQHPFLGAHGLPPLPPLATSTSGTFNNTSSNNKPQRSSFFCSPALHDSASDASTSGSDSNSSSNHSSRDSRACRASQPPSNDSTSSFSSTTTIPLSRPSSPPEHYEHQYQQSLVGSFAHGMPFSNMLDLATAKAENITGLYFAKQMMSGAGGGGGGGEEKEDGQGGKKRTRAVTSTGSPISDSTSALIDSTGKSCASLSPMLVLDGVRVPGSSHSTTALSSSVTTANAQAAPTTAGATATPSTSTPTTSMRHGLHRRSHSASHFFHLSSLKHHSPAQFNLALCYEHGQGGVEQDLSKALYFYQQAADQGHTKASYNLGCICYNQGEISKAMAWFESAGKCCVKGLATLHAGEGDSSCSAATTKAGREGPKFSNASVLECPLPKATVLPHELEDMLMMGEHPSGPDSGASGTGAGGGGGPFVAYLPAILCLALLCRQGVQTREGEVILGRDPDQAIALLQRLLDRAPRRLLNKLEKEQLRSEKDNIHHLHHLHRQQQQQQASIGSRTSASASVRKLDPRKRASLQASLQAVPTLQQGVATSASIFSTSCPQLPLGLSSSMLSSSASAPSCSASTTNGVRVKRRSTVEDAADDDDDDESSFCSAWSHNRNNSTVGPRQASSGTRQGSFLDSEEEKEDEVELLHGSDVHEAWSVTLAQQLLKAWQQPPTSHQSRTTPTSTTTSATSPPSLEDARIQQRIVRHHLLYITNPTLGKNFYNLGVLYDLYLGHPQIAQRCYRSAYHNCRLVLLPNATPVSVQDTFSAQQQQLAGLVTSINSAWNLGVLYAKHQEWARAKGWFLKAQEDVLAHERVAAASAVSASASASTSALLEAVETTKTRGEHRGRRASRGRAGGDDGDVVSDLAALLMKQVGGREKKEEGWSSKMEGLLSLSGGSTCTTTTATEAKQRRSVSKKNVQEEEEDESKIRRRSLVNVLPSPGVLLGQQQSNVSAHGRGRRRGRSGGRDGSRSRGAGGRADPVVTSKDSPGSRHAREHGLMMHLSASSSSKTKGSIKCSKKGASISSRGGSESVSGSEGIRTDASKVAWVLRWVESNMESSMPTSSPFSL